MKKVLSVILVLMISFNFTFISQAQTTEIPDTTSFFIKSAIKNNEIELTEQVKTTLNVVDVLYRGIIDIQQTIDLTGLNLTANEDNYNMITKCLTYLISNSSDIFWFKGNLNFSIKVSNDSSIISEISIINQNQIFENRETYLAQQLEFERLITELVNKIPKNTSDLGKIMFLNDYLAVNHEYDLSFEIYDAYTFLKEKTGVCDSYTKVFTAVMDRLQIPTTRAVHYESPTSNNNHSWNIVKLNGNYYHVDPTWTDPTPDLYGRASHRYFLLSSETLSARDYEDYSDTEDYMNLHIDYKSAECFFLDLPNTLCNDKTYESEDYLWNLIKTPFAFYGDSFYFLYYSGIQNDATNGYRAMSGIYKTQDFLTVTKISDVTSSLWMTPENDAYFRNFFTSASIIDSQIYYNTESSIDFYDLNNSQGSSCVSLQNTNSLYSSFYLGNGVFGYATVEFVKDTESGGYYLSITNGHTSQVENLGDINQNGTKGKADDLISMRRYLLDGNSSGLCLAKGDLAGKDSKIDIKDLAAMKKLAAGVLLY